MVVAASPIAIAYSTRVKQYNLDILLACAVLWLFERWRRRPATKDALWLTVVCSLALLISATTLTVTAPLCLVALIAAWVEPLRRRDVVVLLSVMGLTTAMDYLVWLRHLSNGLHVGWTNRGYLLTFKSAHMLVFSLENMGSQFFHWMIGVPTGHPPDPSKSITTAGIIIALAVAALLVWLVRSTMWPLLRHPKQLPQPLTVAALSLVVAVLLALAGISPFGGGRTDEIIYPGLLLLAAGVVADLMKNQLRIPRLTKKSFQLSSRAALVGVVLAAASCVLVGYRYRAVYPTLRLQALYTKFHPHVQANDFIVVDPWVTFTWGALGLTHDDVSFTRGSFFDWSQGFHVVSLDPHVIISIAYFSRPNSPAGRISSTITMMMNTTVEDASE